MGKPRGFLEIAREESRKRPVDARLRDYQEFEPRVAESELRPQAARCMDCGVPYCHWACPLHNLIPDFNDHIYRAFPELALASLHSTNNFPEITGRVCPAPCEASCTLELEHAPVTIKNIERAIADNGFDHGWIRPQIPSHRTGKTVAIVGSGPAGLASAQELARAGHTVTVFEQDDRIGGLLRYGIPDFKLDKHIIDRRIDQMLAEGVTFRTRTRVGMDLGAEELRRDFDAIVLAGGARQPRDLPIEGRRLRGIHFAMDFLTQQNRRVAGELIPDHQAILATGKKVVILGGGDTGSDCLGTSLRQGAASVVQVELLPEPPRVRLSSNPWPGWPNILRTSSSHQEGGTRLWSVMTRAFLGGDRGQVHALRAQKVEMVSGKPTPISGSDFELPCDLVLLALGFVGSRRHGLLEDLGIELDARNNVRVRDWHTNVPWVFSTGDQTRGQSLVVHAIADGRQCARAVHAALTVAPDRCGR
ncbi:MAG: glutamate synthase subunit beta [Polyangiaceae bacterium]|nr:glutamate synthase subunit beta [Polyangiaceae bacterium]